MPRSRTGRAARDSPVTRSRGRRTRSVRPVGAIERERLAVSRPLNGHRARPGGSRLVNYSAHASTGRGERETKGRRAGRERRGVEIGAPHQITSRFIHLAHQAPLCRWAAEKRAGSRGESPAKQAHHASGSRGRPFCGIAPFQAAGPGQQITPRPTAARAITLRGRWFYWPAHGRARTKGDGDAR